MKTRAIDKKAEALIAFARAELKPTLKKPMPDDIIAYLAKLTPNEIQKLSGHQHYMMNVYRIQLLNLVQTKLGLEPTFVHKKKEERKKPSKKFIDLEAKKLIKVIEEELKRKNGSEPSKSEVLHILTQHISYKILYRAVEPAMMKLIGEDVLKAKAKEIIRKELSTEKPKKSEVPAELKDEAKFMGLLNKLIKNDPEAKKWAVKMKKDFNKEFNAMCDKWGSKNEACKSHVKHALENLKDPEP